MSRYENNRSVREHRKAQADAEINFSKLLEEAGMEVGDLKERFGLSTHEFNVLCHFVYGVNDEPPPAAALAALERAMGNKFATAAAAGFAQAG